MISTPLWRGKAARPLLGNGTFSSACIRHTIAINAYPMNVNNSSLQTWTSLQDDAAAAGGIEAVMTSMFLLNF